MTGGHVVPQRIAVIGVKFHPYPIFTDITLQNLCLEKKKLFAVERWNIHNTSGNKSDTVK